jgi:hypothetical protein
MVTDEVARVLAEMEAWAARRRVGSCQNRSTDDRVVPQENEGRCRGCKVSKTSVRFVDLRSLECGRDRGEYGLDLPCGRKKQ